MYMEFYGSLAAYKVIEYVVVIQNGLKDNMVRQGDSTVLVIFVPLVDKSLVKVIEK